MNLTRISNDIHAARPESREVDTPAGSRRRRPRSASISTTDAAKARLRPMLEAMAPQSAGALAAAAVTREVPRFGFVYQPGDDCLGLYLVVSGRVKLSYGGGKKRRVIALLGPGEWFGEGALLLGGTHAAAVQATEPAVLVQIARETVLRCLNRDPVFALKMLTETSRRLRALSFGAADSSSAQQRVLGFLVRQLSSANARKGTHTIVLPAFKRAIASQLNMTGEHLSRVFRELTEAGLIRIDGRNVHVGSVTQLRAAARAASA